MAKLSYGCMAKKIKGKPHVEWGIEQGHVKYIICTMSFSDVLSRWRGRQEREEERCMGRGGRIHGGEEAEA